MLGFVVLRFFSSIPAITTMLAVTSISAVSAVSAVFAVFAVAIMRVVAMGFLFVTNLLNCPDSSLRRCLDSLSSATSSRAE